MLETWFESSITFPKIFINVMQPKGGSKNEETEFDEFDVEDWRL